MLRVLRKFIQKVTGINSLLEETSLQNRYIRETVFADVFDFTIRDSLWFKKQTLHPGRWAMGFPALYVLYRVLDEFKPKKILEFGLGESTRLTWQYQDHFKNSGLTIIEQDEKWIRFFSDEIFDVKDKVKVLPVTTKLNDGTTGSTYEGLLPVIAGNKFDCVIIDGPIGTESNSRYQLVDIIRNDLLNENFVIIFDDSQRRGEQLTLSAAYKEFEKKGIEYYSGTYSGENDTTLICSSGLKFLTSL